MMVYYPAIFHKEDKGYWVEFPDLEGCLTKGKTFDEALLMAKDALKEWFNAKDFLHVDNFNEPTDLEIIKKKYPKELVLMIEHKEVC